MEDILRGIIIKHSERRGNGLNPCSNGRYSQRKKPFWYLTKDKLS